MGYSGLATQNIPINQSIDQSRAGPEGDEKYDGPQWSLLFQFPFFSSRFYIPFLVFLLLFWLFYFSSRKFLLLFFQIFYSTAKFFSFLYLRIKSELIKFANFVVLSNSFFWSVEFHRHVREVTHVFIL